MMNFKNMGLKLVTKEVADVAGCVGMNLLKGAGVTKAQEQVAQWTRNFAGRKGKKGDYVYKKPGTSGRVLVVEDKDGSFTASITRAGSPDKKGAESGNKIWFITDEEDKDSFDMRYSKGKENLNAARSSAGNKGLTVVYGVDPTQMHKDPELAASVAVKKFIRAYLIHPRYTNWDKIWEKEAKIAAAGGAANKEKPREQALKDEEEAQNKPYIIQQNKDYLELLMKSVAKMIDRDGRVILLHPTQPPYSNWGIDADKCMLKYEKVVPFDAAMYPGFCPRRAGTDLKLDLVPSAFTYYQLRDRREGDEEEEDEEAVVEEEEEALEEEK